MIFICVTASPQVEDLIRRRDGILSAARKGLIVVDCSTSDPSSTLALAAELKKKGTRMIDVPLGNTPKEAQSGDLNAFVGSDAKTLKEIRPIIETWAQKIIHVGPLGHGHKAKLINNFLSVAYGAVYAEAYTACRKTGVDPEKFYEMIAAGGLYSGMFQRVTNYVIGGDPKAHLFSIANCFKDASYYVRMTDAAGMTAPVGAATQQCYALAMAQGAGERFVPMMSDVMSAVNGVPGYESVPKKRAARKKRA